MLKYLLKCLFQYTSTSIFYCLTTQEQVMCCDQHAFCKVRNLDMFPWDTSNFLAPMLQEKQVFLAMMMVIYAQMPIMHVGFSIFLKLVFEFMDPMGLNQTAIVLI